MPLQIDRYVDPSVYEGEVVNPTALNIATTPRTLGVIGVGSRQKSISNEAVQRGLVSGEVLTMIDLSGTGDSISAPVGGIQTLTDAGADFSTLRVGAQISIAGETGPTNNGTFTVLDVPSATTVRYSNPAGVISSVATFTWSVAPFAVLANRSDHKLQNTDAFKNGSVIGDNFLRFHSAYILGTIATDVDLTLATDTNSFGLIMDGITPVTMRLLYNAAPSVVLVGREIQVNYTFSGALGAAATTAEIADAINTGLAAAGTLGFGAAYADVARDTGTGVLITSPVSTVASNVEVFEPIASSGLAEIFGVAGADNRQARSTLEVSRLVYASTAVFTADYIDIDSDADPLANTGVNDITLVGNAAGIGNYTANVDFLQNGDTVDWGGTGVPPDTAPAFIGSSADTYDVSTNNTLIVGIDGKAAVTILLDGLLPAPLGYADPAVPAAATAAEMAANINAVLGNTYGPLYNAVASVVTVGASDYVRLTSPTDGQSGSVTVYGTTALATATATEIFGLQSSQLPYTVIGSGKRPALAAFYFVSYDIDRPSTDYNIQKRFFSLAAAESDLGEANANNPLMIAATLAFRNQAPSIVVVQVDDSSSPGSPTRAEFQAALDATLKTDVITDLVVLSTDTAVQTDLKDHMEYACSPTIKRYRRAWFGLPRNTPIGDKDTADSYVYIARRTLQFAPDSPGRGRAFLVAPPQLSGVSIDVTLSDNTTQRVNLDTTYLAVAIVGKSTSFTSSAATMARKTITGFNLDDITDTGIWTTTERGLLAGQGSMVVTYDAGTFIILDPVSTEAGGGGLAAFSYDSTSPQKDNISRKVEQALDANIIGVVPTDLADFIVDIKVVLRGVLQGEIGRGSIGPFRNANGTTRAIDLGTDIEVEQDANDPTKFFFRYFYNLRYPALRLFGQYSVDNPFFASQQ